MQIQLFWILPCPVLHRLHVLAMQKLLGKVGNEQAVSYAPSSFLQIAASYLNNSPVLWDELSSL